MEFIIPQERHALTIEQRRNALKYLTETRDAVKRHVTNLQRHNGTSNPQSKGGQSWMFLNTWSSSKPILIT
jgi:excinuclease UvrABC nuclease subunit